ncbi:MAG: GNAT family N-acetyltransferase [Acidobacteriaceae bacterium]
MTVLETERVLLRQLTPEDEDVMFRLYGDAETMRYMGATLSRDQVAKMIRWMIAKYEADGYGLWAMVEKSTGETIGDCGLFDFEVNGRLETQLGYHLLQSKWHQGLATEVARAVLEFGKERLGKTRMVALIQPRNEPSLRMAQRLGMQRESTVDFHGVEHLMFVTGL